MSVTSNGIVLDRMDIEEASAVPDEMAAAIHSQMPVFRGAVPIHAIAAALDIVEIRTAPTDGFEGALVMTPDRGIGLIVVNRRSSSQRRRFTIGHELGHFLNIRHRPTNPAGGFTCRSQDLAQPWSPRHRLMDRHIIQEIEANRFAIELLAPRSLVSPFLKGIPDLAKVVELATRLELSREASARRYVELRDNPLALVFSKEGVVRYVERNEAFPFVGLRKGDPMPMMLVPRNQPALTPHDEADPRDWGIHLDSIDLVVQTLNQDAGFSITLLSLDDTDSAQDD